MNNLPKAKKLSRLFVGYTPGKAQNTELQCKTIVCIAYIAAPTAAIFAIINYFSDHLELTLVEIVTVCLLLPCFKLINHPEALPWVRNVLMSTAFLMFTSAFIDGGIAHDFNNMLAGITSNLYLAKQKANALPDVILRLERIDAIAFRAADMIKQLLTFARKDRVDMQQLAFTPFIKETLQFIRPSIPENIHMQTHLCSDPLYIQGDKTQLHQVLMNLVNNARDSLAGVPNPSITIRLEDFYPDDDFVNHYSKFSKQLYAHLSVEDNGCGIAEEHIQHLFEPFYTSKEQGKGTGLGLAMLFGAVKTHHGSVGVKSIEGKGSTFSIYLPTLKADDRLEPAPQKQQASRGDGQTILLVDDDINIIETGKEVLKTLGYRVRTASNGQQAIDLYQKHGGEIDLVIMDIIMPVMGGDQAAALIRQTDPTVNIIFSTGYDRNVQSSLEHEIVLNKPFSIIAMSHIIAQKLQAR